MRGSVKKDGGSWLYIIDIPRGADGRRRQKKKRGFRTRADAERAVADEIQKLSTNSYVQRSTMTVERFLVDQWLPAAKQTLRPSTYSSYERNIRLHVLPVIGGVRVQDLLAPMLNDLYRQLADKSPTTENALSPKSIRHVHTTLRKALADGMRWGVIERNAAELADPPPLKRREMNTWTVDECQRFLAHIAGHDTEPLFVLALTTGMRRGEICGLRWRDIDFDAARLSVRQTLNSVEYGLVFGEPKSARSRRSVPLPELALDHVRRRREVQDGWRKVIGRGWPAHDLVFTYEDGRPLHPDALSDAFKRLVKSSGLRRIRLHDCRHTYATIALENGVPIKVISEVLGHSSPAFTMDVYSHVTPAMMEDLARKVGEILG
ncbi:MAG: site-specific integrase [Actinomycetota bacterium]